MGISYLTELSSSQNHLSLSYVMETASRYPPLFVVFIYIPPSSFLPYPIHTPPREIALQSGLDLSSHYSEKADDADEGEENQGRIADDGDITLVGGGVKVICK